MEAKKIKVLLADDEPAARQSMRILLQHQSDLELVGECCSGEELLLAIGSHKPDVVLLDIQMPDGNGFEVLEALQALQLNQLPLFIFVTAYDQYAIRAFAHAACDYLLKPYDDERFYESLDRARKQLGAKQAQEQLQQLEKLLHWQQRPAALPAQSQYPSKISLKQNRKIVFQEVSSIMYVESEGNFVKLHTTTGMKLGNYTFKQLQELLPPHQFVRIHKSFIVNQEYIEYLEPHFHGDYVVALKGGIVLKMSRNYKEALSQLMG